MCHEVSEGEVVHAQTVNRQNRVTDAEASGTSRRLAVVAGERLYDGDAHGGLRRWFWHTNTRIATSVGARILIPAFACTSTQARKRDLDSKKESTEP